MTRNEGTRQHRGRDWVQNWYTSNKVTLENYSEWKKKKTYVEDEGKRKDLDLVTGMTWLFKKAMLKIAIEPLFDGKLPKILFFT